MRARTNVSVAGLTSHLSPPPALLFMRTFFETLAREWHSIDRLRLDKFYMVQSVTSGVALLLLHLLFFQLIRRFVHHCFEFLKSSSWEQRSATLCSDMSNSHAHCDVSGVQCIMYMYYSCIYDTVVTSCRLVKSVADVFEQGALNPDLSQMSVCHSVCVCVICKSNSISPPFRKQLHIAECSSDS